MISSNDAIAGLMPESLWLHFAEITRIPRGSKNEAAIARHVMSEAARFGLSAKQDAVGNVAVKKPASPGRGKVRCLCLQGHLDMVCEKNRDKDFDFLRDPIELVRSGNVIRANGTTLGADNGIAVATQLAIMEDRSLVHGPLEFLFTVDEETALTGASNLDEGFLESKILMNLDSEEEGTLYVGCSGGKDTSGRFEFRTEAAPAKCIVATLSVTGLKGGHSGLDIDKGRGNAVKILAHLCAELADLGGRLSVMQGGDKRNAIPREAEALLVLPESRWADAQACVAALAGTLRSKLEGVDSDLRVSIAAREGSELTVLREIEQKRLLALLDALPHGVVAMSADMPELVETSTNVASIETRGQGQATVVQIATSQRSSDASELLRIVDTVRSIMHSAGGEVDVDSGYPGWKPNPQSEILAITKESFRDLYGKAPAVKAIHAGLECGVIGERYPGMDMVSLGPTLEAVHSPDERIYIDTVSRFWELLLTVLAKVT
jgi:dipeptidase D